MAEPEGFKTKIMDSQDWVKRWDVRQIGFHNEHIHTLLEKHVSALVDGRSNIKIFVPLCGKSWDMKWLADQGHTVIGVEVAQKAINEFAEEQAVTFTTEPVPSVDGTLFQSEDKRIQIYCCDLFKVTPDLVGQVDGIWDRGSMVAINRSERTRYAELMQSLMAPGCRYLLSALQYDDTKYGGPPHHLADDVIRECYEKNNNVKEIDCMDAFLESHNTRWGIDWLRDKAFLISPQH